MRKRKLWTCDSKGCNEFVQWYRKLRGKAVKLCSKHDAEFGRKHWGRRVDLSELNEDDLRYLEWKEYMKELAKHEPFDVRLFPLEDGTTKVRIRDRQTDETRSFVIKKSDYERFDETYRDLQRKGFSPNPSIDDYVKRLRNGEISEKL